VREDRRELAAAMLAAAREHDAGQSDRLARLRNVERETAELLGVLVRTRAGARVLEIGTSNGYSTLWLADAAEAVGGHVVSVEIEADRSATAAEHLRAAGLTAELRVEDAAETLRAAPPAAYDLVFLDAERPAYAGYLPELRRVLAPQGLLIVDNVLSHAGEVAEFRALVEADVAFTAAEVPIGAGVLLAVRDA
jgi:predicted O-methyltransferase YrrM